MVIATEADAIKFAYEKIHELEHDPKAFSAGRRNNDMVNWLICQAIIGFDVDQAWDHCPVQTRYTQEHWERISRYVEDWLSQGKVNALDYLV